MMNLECSASFISYIQTNTISPTCDGTAATAAEAKPCGFLGGEHDDLNRNIWNKARILQCFQGCNATNHTCTQTVFGLFDLI